LGSAWFGPPVLIHSSNCRKSAGNARTPGSVAVGDQLLILRDAGFAKLTSLAELVWLPPDG
jgi:hypothetical protein